MHGYDYSQDTDRRARRDYHVEPKQHSWDRGFVGGQPLASWPWRLASGAVDYLPALFVWYLLAEIHAVWVGFVIFMAWLLFNSVYMQGKTGQSLGKRLTGDHLAASADTGDAWYLVYPGVTRCFFRLLAHLLDLFPGPPFCIGLIRPAWQLRYRTFADSLAKTVVLSRRANVTLTARPPGAGSVSRFR